jgi:elongation factor Ts
MSNISAADVKRLRESTGVGMMDCKKALEEANGDFDAAVEILRKRGQKVAAKRADRDAKEGVIVAKATPDGRRAVIVEVNAETDFVARNDDFAAYAERIAHLALEHGPADAEALNALPFDARSTVEQASTDMTGKIGEKIGVRRVTTIDAPEGGRVVTYTHPGSRLAVLVLAQGGDSDEAARDAALQVAGYNPVALSRDEVDESIKAKELEIGREQARNEGKPEAILDKIAQGKLERYYKDNVLLEQPFLKDATVTVGDMLKRAGVTVQRFVRYALGD